MDTTSSAEELLQEGSRASEGQRRLAHFAAIIASSDDAIVSKSLDGIVRSWNTGAERLFGYGPEEIVGRSITLLIPAELRQEEEMILARIRNGQRVDHFETERIAKDGRRIPIALTVSPIVDDQGRIVGASKIARDIGARKRAEAETAKVQQLVASEARALGVLNEWSLRLWGCGSLDEGMGIILDAVIELLQADMGTAQLRDGEVLRFAAWRGLDDDFAAHFAETRPTDESSSGRAVLLREPIVIADVEADERYEPFRTVARRAGYRSVMSMPLLTGQREVLGVVSALFREQHVPTDVELRRLDLYARHASDFIQRCHAEEALRRSEEALRERDRHKDEFLAMLAHELRNPLAPIRSGLHVLKLCGQDPVRQQKTLGILDRQVNHLVRLVEDLLDASRIGRGKIELRRETVDLAGVLLQAVESSRPLLEASGHALVVDVPSEPVVLDADPVRLIQVFSNLLNNAAKYTPKGGHIVLKVVAGNGGVVVNVIDNGLGIPPAMLTRVFGLFAQLQPANHASQGGLGIGLALVRALVERHGGSVEAFSEGEGKGSRFVVSLPTISADVGMTRD